MASTPIERRRPRVVVVGAGFGGLSVAQNLRWSDADVLLVDRHGYNTFQPLLYQVATGGLNPGDVTYALRAFSSRHTNVRVRQGSVTDVDTTAKTVELADSDRIDYDYLVLATGVQANYFGIPGAAENTLTIYTRRDALETRDRLYSQLERLATDQGKQASGTIVVVGGGATGVEMAGTLAEMIKFSLPYSHPELDPSRFRVTLVEMADELLAPFKPRLRQYAAKALRERGVELRLGTKVAEVTPAEVRLGDGTAIPTTTVIWASGVAPGEVVSRWGLPVGRGGRIQVEPDLRVVGHPEVFAIGDVSGDSTDPLPQLAQPAIQQGAHVAQMVARSLTGMAGLPFHYKDKGIMATIGRRAAVTQLPIGLTLRGTLAWLAWVALHVLVLLSNRNRISVITNLTLRYLSWPRSTNVIVGDWDHTPDRTS